MGGFVLWMQGIAAAGTWFAIVTAAFIGAFILIVAQRKFWNVDVTMTSDGDPVAPETKVPIARGRTATYRVHEEGDA
jgi:hypothetical protein